MSPKPGGVQRQRGHVQQGFAERRLLGLLPLREISWHNATVALRVNSFHSGVAPSGSWLASLQANKKKGGPKAVLGAPVAGRSGVLLKFQHRRSGEAEPHQSLASRLQPEMAEGSSTRATIGLVVKTILD